MVTTSPAPPPPLAQASQPSRERMVNNGVEDTSARQFPSAFGEVKIAPPSQVSLIRIDSRINGVCHSRCNTRHHSRSSKSSVQVPFSRKPLTNPSTIQWKITKLIRMNHSGRRCASNVHTHAHTNATVQTAKLRIISQEVRDNSAIPVAPAPPPHQSPHESAPFSPQR